MMLSEIDLAKLAYNAAGRSIYPFPQIVELLKELADVTQDRDRLRSLVAAVGDEARSMSQVCATAVTGPNREPPLTVHTLEKLPDGGERRVVYTSRELIEAAERQQ